MGEQSKFCVECGAEMRRSDRFCHTCGTEAADTRPPASSPASEREPEWKPPEPKSDRNKTIAPMLAIFLGGIGLHKFYLGRPLQGVLYLVFFWTFIPALIGFIEGIALLLPFAQRNLSFSEACQARASRFRENRSATWPRRRSRGRGPECAS